MARTDCCLKSLPFFGRQFLLVFDKVYGYLLKL